MSTVEMIDRQELTKIVEDVIAGWVLKDVREKLISDVLEAIPECQCGYVNEKLDEMITWTNRKNSTIVELIKTLRPELASGINKLQEDASKPAVQTIADFPADDRPWHTDFPLDWSIQERVFPHLFKFWGLNQEFATRSHLHHMVQSSPPTRDELLKLPDCGPARAKEILRWFGKDSD